MDFASRHFDRGRGALPQVLLGSQPWSRLKHKIKFEARN